MMFGVTLPKNLAIVADAKGEPLSLPPRVKRRKSVRLTLVSVSMAMLAALFVGIAGPASAAGSSWSYDSTVTVVMAKNTWNAGMQVGLPSTGSPGTITGMGWAVTTAAYPADSYQQLCNATTSKCLYVFGSSGNTSYFNGNAATNKFYMRFLVEGTGTMSYWYITQKEIRIDFTGTV